MQLAGWQCISVSASRFTEYAGDVDSLFGRCRASFLGRLRLAYTSSRSLTCSAWATKSR